MELAIGPLFRPGTHSLHLGPIPFLQTFREFPLFPLAFSGGLFHRLRSRGLARGPKGLRPIRWFFVGLLDGLRFLAPLYRALFGPKYFNGPMGVPVLLGPVGLPGFLGGQRELEVRHGIGFSYRNRILCLLGLAHRRRHDRYRAVL